MSNYTNGEYDNIVATVDALIRAVDAACPDEMAKTQAILKFTEALMWAREGFAKRSVQEPGVKALAEL